MAAEKASLPGPARPGLGPVLDLLRRDFAAPLAAATLADGTTAWSGTAPGDGVGGALAESLAGTAPLPPGWWAASAPVEAEGLGCLGHLHLLDEAPCVLSGDDRRRFAHFAGLAGAVLFQARHAAAIAGMRSGLVEMEALARTRLAAASRYRQLVDRASALAGMGAWEYDLPTDTLTWTDGVYDIFDLPRGSTVSRSQVRAFYRPQSWTEMETLRNRALAEGRAFSLDICITSTTGVEKWVRLTADVDREGGRPVRIFGLKQDITGQKTMLDRSRILAEHDPLTGLANRAVFEEALRGGISTGGLAALLLIDLDRFEPVNETLGHAAGDACLRQVARRLDEAVGAGNLVARTGGGEFAVMIAAPAARDRVEKIGRGIVAALGRPMRCGAAEVSVGASVGVVLVDGHPAEDADRLFAEAAAALHAAKTAGGSMLCLSGRPGRPAPLTAPAFALMS